MSLIAVLVPLAIAVGTTLSKAGIDKLKGSDMLLSIDDAETVFTDHELLIKTLKDHGLNVEAESENKIHVRTDDYDLTYSRANRGDAFKLTATGNKGPGSLAFDIDCLEREYRTNVQSYTYERLIRNLSENGMTVESEELTEDDAIVLTINI